jgi:hypothetical protein
MAQTLKRKAATVESQNTNLIARANRSSLDNPGTVVPRENSRFKATAMPGRLEMVDSNPSISAAKVQQNFETAKDLAKKNCLLSYHSALIAGASVKAAHGAALLSELSSTEEPGCAELLRPAVCSSRTIASVLRRMESRFSSRYRKIIPQTLADVQMHP